MKTREAENVARRVSVGQLQEMQRGEAGDEPAPGFRSPAIPVAEQLQRLVLEDDIAGMPLGQVVGLIRLAVAEKHVNATETEIRDEAERRHQEYVESVEPKPEDDLSDLMHGAEESDYPTASDVPCDRCGGEVVLRTIDEDRRLAQLVTEGRLAEILCDTCGEADPIEPKPQDRAGAEPLVANVHGIGPDTAVGPNPDYDVAADLRALNVEAQCSEELSLGMVIERVRAAAAGAIIDATDAEIVAEAERIWATFSDNRKGPRVATVNPDGTVAEVRPVEMTPDRGEGVGETHHTITDDDGPRWSGAGAKNLSDDLPFGQAETYPVPTDTEFRGKLYRDAPDLANIAERLIGEHGFLSELINCEIRYYWRRKTGVSKGRVKIGYCKRASDLLGHFSGADFIVWLSATTARDGKFTPRQVEAAIFHQLLHIETDDEGNFISARHDFEGFAQEIRHYGTWTEDLKLVVPAVDAARQMGLFDVDDEGIEDDDLGDDDVENARWEAARAGYVEDPTNGAGVLIHADGTLLTDDEIEAMERHELNDDPAEDEDILLDDPI